LVEWITAAREAGFHPVAFSQVLTCLARGERLPENSVVLLFNPAYRTTVEQVLPTLESMQVPALWVTRSPGRIRADRRFVSAHTRRSYSAHALWDFAVQKGELQFDLEKPAAGPDLSRVYRWQADGGITGVNTATELDHLNRLHANIRWSAQEFVDRLSADLPLRAPRGLSAREIEGRTWGVILPHGVEESFDLQADPGQRFASVSWAGTRSVTDLQVDLEIGSWFGEAWIDLRASREPGQRVRVGLMEGKVRVVQEIGGTVVDDRESDGSIRPDEGIRLSLTLQGEQLRLSSPSVATRLDVPVQVEAVDHSLLQVSIYHRIHGAAFAKALRCAATPLPHKDATGIAEGLVDAGPVGADAPGVRAAN
jgi:hypothetical protein